MKRFFVASVVLVACGARTDLGGAKIGSDSGPGACVPPPPTAHCTGWSPNVVGIVAPPPAPNEPGEIDAMLRTGCDALVAWVMWDAAGAAPSVWRTLAIDFGGHGVADPIVHPGLAAQVSGSPVLSLAQNGSRVGALESDETGCRFVALDLLGDEIASVAPVGSPGCGALAPAGGGFSFVLTTGDGLTPATLTALDASGSPGATTTLGLPAGQVFWDRLAFDDQSFLVYTFLEDVSTANDTDWLAPFDASGSALGPQQTMSAIVTAPVTLVPTKTGALGAWTWSAGNVRPLDRHGVPTGPDVNVTGSATVYGTLLLPTPDGDVLYVWSQLDGSSFSLHAIALAPDGTPRGPATLLDDDVEDARLFGAVESSGDRALLVRMTSKGVESRTLDCVL